MPELIEVKIDSLRVSLTNQQRIVVLKQVDADRFLPIWIGPYEAESITIALQEIEVSRPQTHDLLINLIKNLKGRLTQVVISALKDDIFYGTLTIQTEDGTELKIDSRPSDAIAIAVRTHVPILVEPKVMEDAGIIPEEIVEGAAENEETGSEQPADSAKVTLTDERLSIFEDYLKKKSGKSSSDKKKGRKKEGDSSEEEQK